MPNRSNTAMLPSWAPTITVVARGSSVVTERLPGWPAYVSLIAPEATFHSCDAIERPGDDLGTAGSKGDVPDPLAGKIGSERPL